MSGSPARPAPVHERDGSGSRHSGPTPASPRRSPLRRHIPSEPAAGLPACASAFLASAHSRLLASAHLRLLASAHLGSRAPARGLRFTLANSPRSRRRGQLPRPRVASALRACPVLVSALSLRGPCPRFPAVPLLCDLRRAAGAHRSATAGCTVGYPGRGVLSAAGVALRTAATPLDCPRRIGQNAWVQAAGWDAWGDGGARR
jgi:hypothetical protein